MKKVPKKRTATKAAPTGDLSEMISVLPERYRPSAGHIPTAKSYMIVTGDDLKLQVQVLLNKRAFYFGILSFLKGNYVEYPLLRTKDYDDYPKLQLNRCT